jgi:hypothetical protein
MINEKQRTVFTSAHSTDALHFSTYIRSSIVVLLGIIITNVGFYKRSIEILLDFAPGERLIHIEPLNLKNKIL